MMVHDISDDRRADVELKPSADAGSRLVRLRVSHARTGFGIRGCEQLVQPVALGVLVAPDVRCAEKKVR